MSGQMCLVGLPNSERRYGTAPHPSSSFPRCRWQPHYYYTGNSHSVPLTNLFIYEPTMRHLPSYRLHPATSMSTVYKKVASPHV